MILLIVFVQRASEGGIIEAVLVSQCQHQQSCSVLLLWLHRTICVCLRISYVYIPNID